MAAARPSKEPNIRVGIIENGPALFVEPLINISGKFGESLGSKYDSQSETAPQPGISGHKLLTPRGKAPRSTSALNFISWNRGIGRIAMRRRSWVMKGGMGFGVASRTTPIYSDLSTPKLTD